MIIITNINEDIATVNAQRVFRQSIRSKQQTRYAHNWWKSSMVLLTKFAALAAGELQAGVKDEFDMNHSVAAFSGLLIKAIDGNSPDSVQREYAKNLPGIVRATGLKYRRPTAAEITRINNSKVGRPGRPVKHVFYFQNNDKARAVLLVNFPDLLCLFTELDRRF